MFIIYVSIIYSIWLLTFLIDLRRDRFQVSLIMILASSLIFWTLYLMEFATYLALLTMITWVILFIIFYWRIGEIIPQKEKVLLPYEEKILALQIRKSIEIRDLIIRLGSVFAFMILSYLLTAFLTILRMNLMIAIPFSLAILSSALFSCGRYGYGLYCLTWSILTGLAVLLSYLILNGLGFWHG